MSLEGRLTLGHYRVLGLHEQRTLVRTFVARDEQSRTPRPAFIRQYQHDLGDSSRPAVVSLYSQLDELSRFRHPGIVALMDFGPVEHRLTLALDLPPGVSLDRLHKAMTGQGRRWPVHLALYLARSLLLTLHDCHQRAGKPLIHGRVTLNSVYVAHDGGALLTDFALAAIEDAATEAEAHLRFFQSRVASAAPEIAKGGPPSVAGDLYAAGLLLYQLLDGDNPFRGRSVPETLQRVVELVPAPLALAEYDSLPELNRILSRALAKEASHRYESAQQFADELGALLAVEQEARCAVELGEQARQVSLLDWERVERLMASPVGVAAPPVAVNDASAWLTPAESRFPAFVAGLVTDRPRSVSEHTEAALRQARNKRAQRRARGRSRIALISVPALAVLGGVLLGRLSGSAIGGASTSATVSTASLAKRMNSCVAAHQRGHETISLKLVFDVRGELSEARLIPPELGSKRVGACVLEAAWNSEIRHAGRGALTVSLGADD